MNKNTLLAFIIILVSVIFFTSPIYNKFYTEKILKKEYKYKEKTKYKEEKENRMVFEKNNEKKRKKKENEKEKGREKKSCDTIWIENDKMRIGIKETGAIITSVIMKEYTYNDGKTEKRIDLIENNIEGGAQITIGNRKYDNKLFEYLGEEKEIKIKEKSKKIKFKNIDEEGNEVKKIFEIEKDKYFIKMTIKKENLPGERISVGWYCGIEESEKKQQKNQIEKRRIHLYNGENVQHIQMKKEGDGDSTTTGRYQWIGITSKYFFIAVNNDSIIDSDIKYIAIEGNKEKNFNYKIEMSRIAEKQEEQFYFYTGPTKIEELKKSGKKYEKILFPVMGWTKYFFWSEKWFPWLAEKTLILLITIQKIVKDYGITILILTVLIRIITYPMTLSSMKSMEKMKDIQPKVNKIRQKHKNNAKKMNEEIMAYYKKEGVNPLNPGCLPMFLQMPVFISLFVVLRKAIEIRGANTIILPWVNDLSKAEVLISLEKILPKGIPMYGTNVALLPIIMALLTFFQQKMTIKDPNQKAMIYFMPIFMLVLFNSFPSGLVLYWTFSSALQLIQQIFMNKKSCKTRK